MKLKQINWRRILFTSGIAAGCCGLLILLGFVNEQQQALPCTSIDVNINQQVAHDFIDREEILAAVNSRKILGKPIGSINISMLEKKLMSNSYVERAEVYSTVDGKLQINVLQRNPLVRIINMSDEHYYIDRNGKFMPVSDHYSTPVVVASGYIYDAYNLMNLPPATDTTAADSLSFTETPVIRQVFEVASFLEKDTFWNAQAEQIYVNEFKEIEIIPRIGSHRIILGTTEDLEEKFRKLYIFYTKGLKNTGWNNYSQINLKFKNQVVCTKINQ